MRAAVLALCLPLSSALITASQFRLPDDECNCLSWQDAYRDTGVQCGQSEEYRTFIWHWGGMSFEQVHQNFHDPVCRGLFEKIPENFCMNGDWLQDQQWCYVSSKCQNLHGGQRIHGTQVSRKVCQPGADTLLRDKSVSEIHQIAQTHDLKLNWLVKFAYPTWSAGKWSDIEQFYLASPPGDWSMVDSSRHQALYAIAGTTDRWVHGDDIAATGTLHVTTGMRTFRIQDDQIQCIASCATAPATTNLETPAANTSTSGQYPGAAAKLNTRVLTKRNWEIPVKKHVCECMRWKDVFKSGSGVCGVGAEFTNMKGVGDWDYVCQSTLEKLPMNLCINGDLGKGTQWCYVNRNCDELNGGKIVHGNPYLAVKHCKTDGPESKLNQLKPEEYKYLNTHLGLDAGWLARFAFPTIYTMPWSDVEPLFMQEDWTRVPPKHRTSLADYIKIKKPLQFPAKEGNNQPPFHVYFPEQGIFQANDAGFDCQTPELCSKLPVVNLPQWHPAA